MPFLIGIISSIAATITLIWIFRFFLSPKLRICDKVCLTKNGPADSLMFKIVNHGPRPIIDLRIQLHREKDAKTFGPKSRVLKRINLITEHILILNAFDPSDEDNEFFFRFKTAVGQDKSVVLSSILDGQGNPQLRLRVLARDPISQVETVVQKRFSKSDLVHGIYRRGHAECIIFDNVEELGE